MKRIPITLLSALAILPIANAQWETLECEGSPVERHEAGLIDSDGKIYLIGGRRINPVSIFDPSTKIWTRGSASPIEIHHFQPTVYEDAIWAVGAMTGGFPTETPVDRILKYIPKADAWEWGVEIPADRRRGGAGVSIHEGKLYLSCGITRGHLGGAVKWFDCLDLASGKWVQLPDAPHARDHFQSAIIEGKLYLAGGRVTSYETKQPFELTVDAIDVFDFQTGKWRTLAKPLPTPRAGNTTFALERLLIVAGGESGSQHEAHSEVEALDIETENWLQLPSLNRGRHGTGFAQIGDTLYTASGSGNRGGEPELPDIEAIQTTELKTPAKR